MASTCVSSISVPRLTTTLLVAGSRRSSHAVRPRMRDASEATTGAGIDDGAHLDAELGAAIVLRDDAVLRHVDQTTRQVAGVRGLQRGVREALAGAVGRVEVFEHRQAFLEVGNDRRLDDLARRLGHQAAHAGELAHLRRRTARAGMRHHVDRVDLGFAALRLLLGRGDFLHHLLGDFFGRTSTRRRRPCCTSRHG